MLKTCRAWLQHVLDLWNKIHKDYLRNLRFDLLRDVSNLPCIVFGMKRKTLIQGGISATGSTSRRGQSCVGNPRSHIQTHTLKFNEWLFPDGLIFIRGPRVRRLYIDGPTPRLCVKKMTEMFLRQCYCSDIPASANPRRRRNLHMNHILISIILIIYSYILMNQIRLSIIIKSIRVLVCFIEWLNRILL